jgi:hypothetical protein
MFLSKTESDYSGVVSTSGVIVSRTNENYTISAEFNNSSDSYTASAATITNFNGYIRLTATAIDPILTSPAINLFGTTIGKIVIKIRRISGTGWDGSVFYATAGHGYSESYKFLMTQPSWNGTEWAYIQLDANQLQTGGDDFITNTITQIRFDFGTTSADVFDIDYIRYYPINIIKSVITTPSINIAGTSYTSLVTESVNSQIFTANGFWQKPSWATTGNELVIVHMWGGGGSGSAVTDGSIRSGGGGGAFVFGYFKGSQANQTVNATGTWCNVIVGRGGADVSSGTSGNDGENSIFYANTTNSLVAYGGGGAFANSTTTFGGGGGGWLSKGSNLTSAGGSPLGGTANTDSTFGGGGGANTVNTKGGSSVYGGGGGATGNSTVAANGGISIYGGGGGSYRGVGGTSVYGGPGANSSSEPNSGIPGGGGAGWPGPRDAGFRGEVRVYTLRITG